MNYLLAESMKKSITIILGVVVGTLVPALVWGWGTWAHKEITRQAITLLPAPLSSFFNGRSAYLVEHSVDPDLVRRQDTLEQFNHYIDIDHYGAYPFAELPRKYKEAVAKYTLDSLRTYGLLPWKIAEFTDRLSEAMKSGDAEKILHYASFLEHYVEDAFVPLHATLNYDGQLSGQKGIHRRFESEIPERFGAAYEYSFSDSLEVIRDPLGFAFSSILQSALLADSVLEADRVARDQIGDAAVIVKEKRGHRVDEYTSAYFLAFNHQLRDIPRRRMEAAAIAVARYWYTAWKNAGEPALDERK